MSKQKEIESLEAEIKKAERDLYRAKKQMYAWNRGSNRQLSNAQKSKDYVDSAQMAIKKMHRELAELKKS